MINQSQSEQQRTMMAAPTPAESGAFLRRRRLDLELTLDQVVERAGIPSRQYLHKLESGGVHAAKSKYLPHLVSVLSLSEDDWSYLTGQPRMVSGSIDILNPVLLNAATALVLNPDDLPEIGAYRLESEPGVIVMSRQSDRMVLTPGGTYVVVTLGEPRRRVFSRGQVVVHGDGQLLVVVDGRAYPPESVHVVGRIVFEGRALE